MAEKKVSKSLERVVAETAMLAGETMLIAGAEISRVEYWTIQSVNHIPPSFWLQVSH